MACIEGQTLKDKIAKGPLEINVAVDIAVQVGEGLKAAHEKGIIHRDIKPANIMLTEKGRVKVMDFGLARLEWGADLTRTPTALGTIAYMSPEQARAETVDCRTDIWSLGCTLFEMLSGHAPFRKDHEPATMCAIVNENPAPLSSLRQDIPAGLEKIVQRCLQKNARDRYPDAGGLIEELKSITLRGFPASPPIPSAKEQIPSIAVLPFVDLSPRKDQEYFCDGVAEELINALTHIMGLRVVARTSAFAFKGRNLDVRDVGRVLNVKTVLEGSIRKAGRKLRITAQLINVATGYHFWSEKYERTFEDVFAIQDEITLAIVDRLKVKLLGEEKAALLKRHTENPEAYNLYLMGRFFWNKRTAEGMKRGLECFVRAIQLDPSFARAFAGIADCYAIIAYYYAPPRPTLMKAKEAAAKALEIDDTLAEAQTSMAFIKHKLERDWVGAEQGFRRAIELNPEYAWAHHWYAVFLAAMGRHQESFAEIKRALAIDPTSAQMNMVHGMVLYLARFYDQAVEELTKAVELDPQHVLATFFLGLAHLECGRYEEALILVERSVELAGHAGFFVQGVGYVHASAGRKTLAQGVLARVAEMTGKAYFSPVYMALIHFRMGENDRGFEWLDKAYTDGDHWLEFIKVFPGFDNARIDPRYAALVQKLGLE